jgi:argininosuccinate lyase
LWGGRFSGGPAPTLEALNKSLPVDARLWREDIEGSGAWVQALLHAGILTDPEAARLDEGLRAVEQQLESENPADAPDEDIHTLVERRLYEQIGDVAGKLHTGRSRNDQVATDTRLWALRASSAILSEIRALQAVLLDQAEATIDLLMPSYTHLRRAQPIRVAHWLLAHFWALQRDHDRLTDALDRIAVLPLGSGAIAGSGFAVDRELLRQRLGFRSISPNSLDAVGDRDWMAEALFIFAMLATHLSRMAEDLIIFSTDEFAFLRLPEAFTTGSSLMPQKRNPDGLELTRGMAARLIGETAGMLAMLKSVPSGYNKDLQEDKRILFGAFDTLMALLPATRETIRGVSFNKENLERAVRDENLMATDLADELVRRGVPFREAHGAVGRLLRAADEAGTIPSRLPDAAWAAAHPAFLRGGRPGLSPVDSVEARSVQGGTARTAVVDQLTQARAALG